jgi:hypothetical protein
MSAVDHPQHYSDLPATCAHCAAPIECIQVVRHLSFDLGNAIKYIWREAGKNGIEDLSKAIWYLNDEINERQNSAVQQENSEASPQPARAFVDTPEGPQTTSTTWMKSKTSDGAFTEFSSNDNEVVKFGRKALREVIAAAYANRQGTSAHERMNLLWADRDISTTRRTDESDEFTDVDDAVDTIERAKQLVNRSSVLSG